MARDRVLGSSCIIDFTKADGTTVTAEIDSFSASAKHELKARSPLGEVGERNQVIYKGYDLDFKAGKVDRSLVDFFYDIDQDLIAGKSAPRVRVTQTIKHFDGSNEIWIYPDVVLYGYKDDASNAQDEIKEEFKGSASVRNKG